MERSACRFNDIGECWKFLLVLLVLGLSDPSTWHERIGAIGMNDGCLKAGMTSRWWASFFHVLYLCCYLP
mgnify:CR=1 FL=1